MKTTRKILSILLIAMLLIGTVVVPLNTIKSEAATLLTLQQLKQKFPHGKYWNGGNANSYTSSPCTHHYNCTYSGSCGCNSFNGVAIQCFGFALKLGYDAYGTNPQKWQRAYNLNNIKPGDIINYNGSNPGHTVFVTEVKGNVVYFAECNWSKSCLIEWGRSLKKSEFNNLYNVYVAPYSLPSTNTLTVRYNANGGTINSEITTVKYKVKESAGLNMRSGAGTNYSVLKTLPKDTTFSVVFSERKAANGYTWGKITYGGATGWVVISDFVQTVTINRTKDYYLYSSLVYKTSAMSALESKLTYGQTLSSGLYNAATFGLTRDGYEFVGWSLTANGSTTIFDEDDSTLKPETIYPNLKTESATVVLYAIWECNHSYDNNCDTSCNTCGKVRSTTHDYKAATCTAAKTCKVCGTASGSALGHSYDNACDTNCNRCNASRSITHDYKAATCTAAKTCKVCGTASGSALGHSYDNACDATCNVCGKGRKVGDHAYANNSDTTCNSCGAFAYPSGNTLYNENGVWYHIVNRQKVTDTTLVQYNGTWYYVNKGKVDFLATTLVSYSGQWWYVKGGKLDRTNTLVLYNGAWYHVNNGQWVKDTTLVQYNGTWYYVKNGMVDFSATTLASYNGIWWSVKGGKLDRTNTLVQYGGQWYHVNNGQWVKDTTLVKYNNTWYYVNAGRVSFSANTLVKYNNIWYHVNGGKLVRDNTLVQYNGKWYYVRNGQVDFKYNGRVLYGGKYYTVKNGVKA